MKLLNIKTIVFLSTLLLSLSAFAGMNLPANFLQLSGAFKGKSVGSDKTAYLLVYNEVEDGQPSGHFDLFVLSDDANYGQILEADYVDPTTLAVLADGASNDGKILEPKLPPAGVLELALDSKWGQVLRLSKQDGTKILRESYVFFKNSDDIQINPGNPIGLFKSRHDTISSTTARSNSLDVIVDVPSLHFDGKFIGVLGLSGVVVLRERKLDNSEYQYSEGQISGLMVSIYNGRKPMVVVGRVSDGSPQVVSILPANRGNL